MKDLVISNKIGGAIKILFLLKDKNDYKSYVICKEDCSCGSCYIGETKYMKSPDLLTQLLNNIDCYFTWTVIPIAPKNPKTR